MRRAAILTNDAGADQLTILAISRPCPFDHTVNASDGRRNAAPAQSIVSQSPALAACLAMAISFATLSGVTLISVVSSGAGHGYGLIDLNSVQAEGTRLLKRGGRADVVG